MAWCNISLKASSKTFLKSLLEKKQVSHINHITVTHITVDKTSERPKNYLIATLHGTDIML